MVARANQIHGYKADCDVTFTFPRNWKKKNKIQLSVNAMDPEEVKVVGKEQVAFKILLQLTRMLTNLVFSFVVYGARNLQPKKGDGE